MRKTLLSLAAAAALLSAGSAFALGGNANNSTNVTAHGGAGGHGGHGGAGGKADAMSISGAASNATATNRTDVSTDVRNTNTNVNSAAQHQGQVQGQQQAAVAGSHSGGNSFSSSVAINESQRPVSSALAAPLAASNGTCMGSSSVGGQGVTVGVSFGTTWTDAECNRRYNSIRMQELGQTKAAVALMCQDADVAAAMKIAGTPCPGTEKVASAPAAEQSAKVKYTDPIIRRRLGLPPL